MLSVSMVSGNRVGQMSNARKSVCFLSFDLAKVFLVKLYDETSCSNTIYQEYGIGKNEIDVSCNLDVCSVSCKNQQDPWYIDSRGLVEQRNVYSCQGGSEWHPNDGRIACEKPL